MYVHLAVKQKNWFDVLLIHEGIVIVVQMFVKVPLKNLKAWFCAIYPHHKNNPLFHSYYFEIVYTCMMRVLCLHFCYAIHSRQNEIYSINPILKLNTPIVILHELWSYFGPCNTLTLTHMMVLHNLNKNRINQIRVLQLN